MNRTTFLRVVRGSATLILSAIALFLAAGFLLSSGWHLIHGRSISYAGWNIPVPRGYFVISHGGTPTMWRLAPGAPKFQIPYGALSFRNWTGSAHPFSREADYQSSEAAWSQAASESGHHLESSWQIPIQGKTGYCWEFTRKSRSQPRSLVRCAIEGSNIYLFYEGDPQYSRDVTAIMEGMSSENAAR